MGIDAIVTGAAALIVAGTFTWSAAAKLADPAAAVAGARELGPVRLARPVGRTLPFVEALAALLIAVPATRRLGAAVVLVLLLGFSVAIARVLRGGHRPPCHCFGRRSRPVGPDALVRNAALGVLALAALVGP